MTKKANAGVREGWEYAEAIVSGELVSGQLARRACERALHDREHAEERGYYFDPKSAGNVMRFFPEMLKHENGKPFLLEPSQAFSISQVYGWKKKADNFRRFITAYKKVGRKGGKSSELAGLGLHAVFTAPNGSQIYCGATKRDQSMKVVEPAINMAADSPELKEVLRHQRKNDWLVNAHTRSRIVPLARQTKGRMKEDGHNVYMSIIDETHAHEDSELWNVMRGGMGAQDQPLIWGITTAGFINDGLDDYLMDISKQVLAGFDVENGYKDDRWFALIYTLDGFESFGQEPDDIFDERNWYKANPCLGTVKSLEDMRDMAKQAKINPVQMHDFCTKHLNIKMAGAATWMDMNAWNKCKMRSVSLEGLHGRTVYAGLDLGNKSDLSALALVSPSPDGDYLDVWVHFWVPSAACQVTPETKKRSEPEKYAHWAKDGFLTVTPGNTCDYNEIRYLIGGYNAGTGNYDECVDSECDLRMVFYDRAGATRLIKELEEQDGVTTKGFGQGYFSMNPAMTDLMKLVLEGEINVGNNPILDDQAFNMNFAQDTAGNVKPDKGKTKKKIDGMVALIMAIGAWQSDGSELSTNQESTLMVV